MGLKKKQLSRQSERGFSGRKDKKWIRRQLQPEAEEQGGAVDKESRAPMSSRSWAGLFGRFWKPERPELQIP